jgi:hypothetical protein
VFISDESNQFLIYSLSVVNKIHIHAFFFLWRRGLTRAMASSFLKFLHHIQRRTTVCRTPLAEWSAVRRNLYLKTHTTPTREKHCFPWQDSNPQSQQASRLIPALKRAATAKYIPYLIIEYHCTQNSISVRNLFATPYSTHFGIQRSLRNKY